MKGVFVIANFKGPIHLKSALYFFSFVLFLSFYAVAEDFSNIEVGSGQTQIVPPTEGEVFEAAEVHLEENSTLVLQNFKSILIQKLVAADGAHIRLSANANGGDGQQNGNGTNGANIRFFLGNIEGHVVIEARGGKGGDGRDGRDGRQGANGLKGRNGRTALFGLFYLGNGDDGQPGLAGEDGEDGEDGGHGGDGGHVALFYREKNPDTRIVIDVNGGEAGRAGRGGIAGLGGNGGAGGRGIKNGKQGPMGPKGKAGRPGRPNFPGKPGEAVVYQLDQDLFQCLISLDLLSYHAPLNDEDYNSCRESEGESLKASMVLATSAKKEFLSGLDPVMALSCDGDDGKNAPAALIAGATPPPASSGSAGGQMTLLVRDTPQSLLLTARGGSGGRGGDGAHGSRGADGKNGRNSGWFKKAKPGGDAQDGGDAGSGSDGGSAGAGGHIRVVYIPSTSEAYDPDWASHFSYDVSAGRLGLGGQAGIGGRAGLGGQGGKISKNKYMPNGRDGIRGQDGKAGHEGEPARDGVIEFYEAQSYNDWVVLEFKRYLENYGQNF